MTHPGLGEYLAGEALGQVRRAQAASAQVQAEAAVEQERLNRWGEQLLSSTGGVMEIREWSYEAPSLQPTGGGIVLSCPLDLRHAVSVTASFAGNMPQAESHGERDGYLMEHRELVLAWQIQDSLDGSSWFVLANGTLTHTQTQQVVRITQSLGTRLQLWIYCYGAVALLRRDNKSTQQRDQEIGNPANLSITDLRVNVAVRGV